MNITLSARPLGWWFSSDEIFNTLFPTHIQRLAKQHWTPLSIARTAIEFLTPHDNARVLDIGSGVGKLCLAGAHFKPSAFFTGVEQRGHLVDIARDAQVKLQLDNTNFYHDNFTGLDFNDYHHFYFFNSFYENLSSDDKIDDSIEYTEGLYTYYVNCLYKKLADMPPGTRIVTYHSLEDEIPFSYHAIASRFNNRLKCWIRE